MTLLTELAKWYGIGVMAAIALPIFARVLPWSIASKIVQPYASMAMAMIDRGLLLERSHGGHRLISTKYNAQKQGETKQLGGDVAVWKDPHNYMSTFKGQPFGLAHEDSNLIIDARMAYLGRRFRQLHEEGRWRVNDHFKRFFEIPNDGRELVRISDGLPINQGSASPALVQRVWEYIEKGQKLFNSSRVLKTMKWLIAMGATMGMMYFAAELASKTGGGTTVPVPLVAGGLL